MVRARRQDRTLAAGLVTDGKVRVNRERIDKPSQALRPGDVVTVTVRGQVRILKVLARAQRRGPPAEARLLFEDLHRPPPPCHDRRRSPLRPQAQRAAGAAARPSASGARSTGCASGED